MAAFFEMPDGETTPLEIAPRLASWMARDHPDQVRLTGFIDHAEAVVEGSALAMDGPLALRLDIGLPPTIDPLKHHDLDNYLFPLVTRLGPRRFASVWGTKARAPHSSIRVDTARRAAEGLRATLYRVRATRSAQTAAWKEEIRDQLLGAAEIADGPVKLELSLRVGPGRNWANLWKPAIESLGPILGSEGSRPWNPRDGRVVQLGLHQEVDASLGHAVEITVDAESVASPSH